MTLLLKRYLKILALKKPFREVTKCFVIQRAIHSEWPQGVEFVLKLYLGILEEKGDTMRTILVLVVLAFTSLVAIGYLNIEIPGWAILLLMIITIYGTFGLLRGEGRDDLMRVIVILAILALVAMAIAMVYGKSPIAFFIAFIILVIARWLLSETT